MGLKKLNWAIVLTIIWLVTLCGLGLWWLFIIFKLANMFEQTNKVVPFGTENWVTMLELEGATFFILLLLISLSLFFLYYKDYKKNVSMQTFFASLTHELKTPLASMRLQAEVINEITSQTNSDQLSKLTERLIEDAERLEIEMDKILSLSRLELGSELTLSRLDINSFLQRTLKKYRPKDIQIDISCEEHIAVYADEFILELVLRNLLDNTKKHSTSKNANIDVKETQNDIDIIYNDHSGKFKGDIDKLGKLFYKYNSKKGSGIGLYLAKGLLKKMNGEFIINNESDLIFTLRLKKYENN